MVSERVFICLTLDYFSHLDLVWTQSHQVLVLDWSSLQLYFKAYWIMSLLQFVLYVQYNETKA